MQFLSEQQVKRIFRDAALELLGIDTDKHEGDMRIVVQKVNGKGLHRMRAEIIHGDDVHNIIADVDYGMQLISLEVFTRHSSVIIPVPSPTVTK